MVTPLVTRSLLFASAACLLGACVPDFSTDLSELREPRLLAIASEPAEAGATKQVTLSALVAVPDDSAAPPLDWSVCMARKSLTELGPVNPVCLGLEATGEPPATESPGAGGASASASSEPAPALLPLGSGASVQAKLDADVCKLFGPLRPPPKMGQAAGRPVDPDITGGFYQPIIAALGQVPSLGAVRIDCDPANVARDDALEYRRRYRANENPRIDTLALRSSEAVTELDPDARVDVKPGSHLELRAAWLECPTSSECGDGYCTADEDAANCAADCAAGQAHGCPGAEPYVWYNRESSRIEPRFEAISVAWYASSGHFESEQTGLDEAQARSSHQIDNVWHVGAAAGNATVWVVVRDSRGGQSWRVQRFRVAP